MKRSDKLASDSNPLAFLMGGGEMGSLIRSMDWSKTALGPVETWPQSLRTTVNICLASDLPICVIWGPGLVQLYNDAYRVICGNKHPRSMGQNFSECWTEAWPVIGEAHDLALSGDTAFLESQQIFLKRHGYVEECFFTFSFSPIRDEDGRVGGLFHPVIEMTTQMLSERRTRTLRDLTAQASKAKSVSEALCLSAQALAGYELDLPFVQLYAVDPDGDQARLVSATGLKADELSSFSADLEAQEQNPWPLDEVIRAGFAVLVDDARLRIGPNCNGPYPEPPHQALVLPITLPGASRPTAIFIAGVSSRLTMNEAYRSFYDLLTFAVTTSVTNARAFDDERRRVEALAELDRAKIAFFANVSHEFRTPLTLMLGPVEDLLGAAQEHLSPLQRERLEVVHRNALRLQRLVNSLLDFSRIEAGRVEAAYEPTALADFTADLASNFRSACEKAGLALRVDCPPLSEPVFVDRPMWETIILNLMSNAFKFTFEGEIAVSLRQVDRAVELRVRDTGTGVPAEEVPLLFERFYRVENAPGRTHEGSGIGLALVKELVKLHGGSISADSELGRGTTFTILIPLGSQHLPDDHVGNRSAAAQSTTRANAYVEEALRWLPDADQGPALGEEFPSFQDDPTVLAKSTQRPNHERPLVLVADDNADMRQYLVRMLSPDYRTQVVLDGEAAMAAARVRKPDLIITDVMMPRLDGFGLLRALRADPRTSDVPVIMLSARAGEESRIEGMQGGADDYLVKPFSGRELLVRVKAHLQMARMRRENIEAIKASEAQFRALVSASSDVVYRMNADWTELRQLQGREFIADNQEPNRSWLEKYIQPDDQRRVLETIREAVRTKGAFELEHQVLRADGTLGWTFSRAIPRMDSDGTVVEWIGMASDVTARKQAQQALRESEQKYRTLFESMDEGYCVIEMIFDADHRPVDYRFLEINPAFEKHTGLRNAQGKRMLALAPDHDAHWFETYGRVAVTGEAMRFVNEAKALDGRWFDVYAFRLGDNGSHRVALLFNDISGRKASEDALRASETRSRTILESITDGFFALDADWRIAYFNSAAERYLDRTSADLIGKSLWDEFPGALGSEFERVYRRVVDRRVGESFTAYYPNFDRWYELTAYPASEGLSVYFRDVTDARRTDELLRVSEGRQRLALDGAELGMWHVNPATRATKTDARFRAIFGATEEWTDYLQVYAVIHPDDLSLVQEAVAAATRVEDPIPYAIEYRIVHPDGSLRWVFAKGRSSTLGADPAGRVISFDGTVADITDRKRGEQELERLVSRLREEEQRKDEFLATLAHELRNPLAPIRNGLQIMRLAPGDAAATERIRSMMERQLGQMVHLIDDLLDLSRISRGKIDLRKERIELAVAVQQAIEASQPYIAQADHELLVKFPPGPIHVNADLTRLVQVFSNLLNNAAKFTEPGGRIRLSMQQQGTEAIVSVQDNGIGIPTQMLPHVFEMFRQVEGRQDQSKGGLGIGLSIVKSLVEMHGGSVEARSDAQGGGSEFVVRLPVALSATEKVPTEQPDPIYRAAGLRILVVDDNQDAAETLAMMLTMMGNETMTAHDGLKGLEVSAAFRPDVMFLDIGMPKLDGYEVGRRIRQQAWGKDIVLVALTGRGQEDDKLRSLEAGLDAHLVKPVLPSVLEKLLAGVTAASA
jgi:PAS domain S-box-containing protein